MGRQAHERERERERGQEKEMHRSQQDGRLKNEFNVILHMVNKIFNALVAVKMYNGLVTDLAS